MLNMTHIASFLKARVQNVAASSTTKKGPTSLTINYHQLHIYIYMYLVDIDGNMDIMVIEYTVIDG